MCLFKYVPRYFVFWAVLLLFVVFNSHAWCVDDHLVRICLVNVSCFSRNKQLAFIFWIDENVWTNFASFRYFRGAVKPTEFFYSFLVRMGRCLQFNQPFHFVNLVPNKMNRTECHNQNGDNRFLAKQCSEKRGCRRRSSI